MVSDDRAIPAAISTPASEVLRLDMISPVVIGPRKARPKRSHEHPWKASAERTGVARKPRGFRRGEKRPAICGLIRQGFEGIGRSWRIRTADQRIERCCLSCDGP